MSYDPATNIFHPDWRPGKRMKEKAARKAAHTGRSVEQELAWIIEDRKAAHRLSLARNAQDAREGAELREAIKQTRREVFPEPQSVHAIPTGVETNRRKH